MKINFPCDVEGTSFFFFLTHLFPFLFSVANAGNEGLEKMNLKKESVFPQFSVKETYNWTKKLKER